MSGVAELYPFFVFQIHLNLQKMKFRKRESENLAVTFSVSVDPGL